MSYCREDGKDKIVFLTEQDANQSASVELPAKLDTEPSYLQGPVLPNGDLNIACQCIESEIVGPCGSEFKEFRQFIHDHKNDPVDEIPDTWKDKLDDWYMCTQEHPKYYPKHKRDDDDDDLDAELESIIDEKLNILDDGNNSSKTKEQGS